MGDNCQISKSIFDETQKQLIEVIKRLKKEFVNHDKFQQKVLLKSLVKICKFKLSREIIEQVFQLLQHTLMFNKEMDN